MACYQQDTVLVNTGYIVRAISDEEASDSVNNGRYIEEHRRPHLKEEENGDF